MEDLNIPDQQPNKLEVQNKEANIWRFFTKILKNRNQLNTITNQIQVIKVPRAECNICKLDFYYEKGCTSTLIRHLKIHPLEKEKYENLNQGKKSQDNKKQRVITDYFSVINTVFPSEFLFWKSLLLIKTNSPLLFVDNQGFHDICSLFSSNLNIPGRKSIKEQIIKIQLALASFIKEDIKNNQISKHGFTINFDHWTNNNNQQQFLTVNLTLITPDFNLKSLHLSTFLVINHKHQQIDQDLSNLLLEFNLIQEDEKYKNFLDLNQLLKRYIVADNAHTNGAAVKISNHFFAEQFIGCFAHTIQNSIHQIIEEDFLENIFYKIKKINSFFKQSHSNTLKLKEQFKLETDLNYKSLQREYTLAWDSWHRTLDNLINVKIPIKQLTNSNNPKLLKYDLSEIEWIDIEQVKNILEKIYQIQQFLSQENDITINHVKPSYISLLEQLKPKINDSELIQKFKVKLINIMKQKYENHFRQTGHILNLAAFLDPNNKDMILKQLSLQQEQEMIDHLIELSNAIDFKINQYEQINNNKKLKIPTILHDQFNLYSNNKNEQLQVQELLIQEIQQYKYDKFWFIKIDQDLLYFQSTQSIKYPLLSKLVKIIFCIHATSSQSERVFSQLYQYITLRRNRTGPSLAESFFNIKYNLQKKMITENQLFQLFQKQILLNVN
ncbi:hypothetical protein ABPG72_016547 [Tetrahymena utriculariae]